MPWEHERCLNGGIGGGGESEGVPFSEWSRIYVAVGSPRVHAAAATSPHTSPMLPRRH